MAAVANRTTVETISCLITGSSGAAFVAIPISVDTVFGITYTTIYET